MNVGVDMAGHDPLPGHVQNRRSTGGIEFRLHCLNASVGDADIVAPISCICGIEHTATA